MTVDIGKIRREYEIPQTVTDEEIAKAAEKIKELDKKRHEMRVGNYLTWAGISERYRAKRAIAENASPGRAPAGFADRYLTEASELFIEGFYGPTLTWARAALERLLQEQCMRFPDLKGQIEAEMRNPSIKEMIKALSQADSWDAQTHSAVDTIETNGDWAVHHRLDQYAKGKKFGDYKLGIMEVKTTIDKGLQPVRPDLTSTVELNLGEEQRRRCIESLTALCTLFERYRS